MDTPTPSGLNEQHVWGGHPFPDSISDGNEQITFIGQQALTARMQSPQARIIASDSDTLFYPTTSGHPSLPFILPDVPYYSVSNKNHAYNQVSPRFSHIPINREHLSEPPIAYFSNTVPFSSSYSSYNNPGFTVPPKQYKHPPLHEPPVFRPPLPKYPIPSFNPISLQLSSHSLPTSIQSHPPFSSNPNPIINPQPNQAPLPNSGPIQYVYCLPPPPPSSSQLLPSSKTLPSVSHIPLLTNKFDFFAWDDAVTSLLRANGLIGHIMDPSETPDPSRLDRIPAPLPLLP
ncbi:hypothetical protein BYT27DRAFT_7250838, partial [Phlegmacium glaucopus]